MTTASPFDELLEQWVRVPEDEERLRACVRALPDREVSLDAGTLESARPSADPF